MAQTLEESQAGHAQILGHGPRLHEHGLKDTEASITSKLARGSFAATFFLGCIAALGLTGLSLEDI
jgi:hypothetical protein